MLKILYRCVARVITTTRQESVENVYFVGWVWFINIRIAVFNNGQPGRRLGDN